jgi:Endonuclease-reverse transcriptase
MTKLAELLRTADKNSVFIGDFNLPSVDWKAGRNCEKIVIEAAEDMFLQQLLEFSTHIKGNTLDLVLTNIQERIIEIKEEGRLGKSDHVMITTEICVASNRQPEPAEMRPDWARADWARLKQQLQNWDWRAEMHGRNTEVSWTTLREKLNTLVEEYVPVRPKRANNRPPWMSQEILKEIRKKKRMWKHDKNRADKTEYKQQEKKVRNLIRNAKKKFEKRLADGGGQNKRPFYSYVKTSTKVKQGVGPLKDSNRDTVTENEKMADLLNKTFAKVFTREGAPEPGHQVCSQVSTTNVPEPESHQQGESLQNIKVTVREVKEKIKKLKKYSAAGPDGIDPGLLQELIDEVAPILANIYNKSMATGQVPSDWREANVTPIFKKGAKTAPENYRPVSLTSLQNVGIYCERQDDETS